MSRLLTVEQYSAKRRARVGKIPTMDALATLVTETVTATVTAETSSLRDRCPTPYDQENLGSCTGNAIAAAIDVIEPTKTFKPSRLFIYQNECLVEEGKLVDHGADDMDGLVYISKNGVCSETVWPYIVSNFTVKPPVQAYEDAKKHICTGVFSIPKDANFINNIKEQIAKGIPVLVGLTCFASFDGPTAAQTGIIPMPAAGEPITGGHEMLAIGYDQNTLTCLNSWGPTWGDKGYAHFPLAYVNLYFDEANYITGFINN